MGDLAELARASDETVARARRELVDGVRRAAARGMSQRAIAREIGRSQPEVSRLLRFHASTPLGLRLRAARDDVRQAVANAGGSNVRVFGSVARESDVDGSDIDLLFSPDRPLSLMELSALEDEISVLVGHPVDLVPDTALRESMRQRILDEAVAL
ncbi:nucleotidyltransferase family protein [Georgenia sp. Z1344]|uniref:nucleotidyltransferase family protein n=1 Tax=Georgenia sp. Z1344 TaxID=3416706 RepID=UPI003CFAE1B8